MDVIGLDLSHELWKEEHREARLAVPLPSTSYTIAKLFNQYFWSLEVKNKYVRSLEVNNFLWAMI